MLPSSGQTLALAEPEARLYNHQPTHPDPPDPSGANVCIAYISAISQRNELKFFSIACSAAEIIIIIIIIRFID